MIKTITYNPETHVLVPREPSEEMLQAATADSCWEDMNPPPSVAYRSMLAAAPKPEPVESEPVAYYSAHYKTPTGTKEFHGLAENPLPAGTKLYTTPQPDRTAELEAALKVARDGIDKFLVANDPTEFGCACDLSVGYLCGPCHADKQQEPLKIALAKINEVLKP